MIYLLTYINIQLFNSKLLVYQGSISIYVIWLVVSTPLKNMKVRLDHHPNYYEK